MKITQIQTRINKTLVARLMTISLAFGYNWILSRCLGAEGLGIYQIVLSLALIGSTIAGFGLNNVVLRLFSANIALGRIRFATAVYQKAMLWVGLASFFWVMMIQMVAYPIFEYLCPRKTDVIPFVLQMSWAIIPTVLCNLFIELLKGIEQFSVAVWLQNGFTAIIAIIAIIVLNWCSNPVLVAQVINVFIGSTWGTLILAIYCFYKNKPIVRQESNESFEKIPLLEAALPLWTTSLIGIFMEHLDICWIGIYIGAKEAGIYAVAKKIASLNNFFLVSTNMVVATQFAKLYAENKMDEMKYIAQTTTKNLFWVGFASFCCFALGSKFLLHLFGNDFTEGWQILIILSVGQFVNVATGSVGYLLLMTGNETLHRTNTILTFVLTMLMMLLLTPFFASLGVAMSVMFSVAFQNLRAVWLVHKQLKFYTIKFKPLYRFYL
jgi:O-antigen/teichoic acid export membrane protein